MKHVIIRTAPRKPEMPAIKHIRPVHSRTSECIVHNDQIAIDGYIRIGTQDARELYYQNCTVWFTVGTASPDDALIVHAMHYDSGETFKDFYSFLSKKYPTSECHLWALESEY